jgi:tetratricopeptide (TPR) repeat protein
VLFGVLCCLEDADRQALVVERVWPVLWRELGAAGDPPPTAAVALAPLVGRGLVAVEGDQPAYRVHPGVAEAGRAQAGGRVQERVDGVLAMTWRLVFEQAVEAEGGEAGGPALRAARAAIPYLLRLEEWAAASSLLGQVMLRDGSPGTARALLPSLHRIVEATRGSDRELADLRLLARAEGLAQPDAVGAERTLLERAVAEGQLEHAASFAMDLANALWRGGRLEAALGAAEQGVELAREAGLGPWTQLAGQAQQLQLLGALGRNEEVLAEVNALRDQLATLPERGPQPETVEAWNAREALLDTGAEAAGRLGRWQEALDFSAEVARSRQARGATAYEVAGARLGDYHALLRLGRLKEAEGLLLSIREVFEAERDLDNLGLTLGAMADLESARDRPVEAARFERIAMRYAYAVMNPEAASASHFNLAIYLEDAGGDQALILAHKLAAALIEHRSASGRRSATLAGLAGSLARAGDPPPLPGSFEELCDLVGQVEAVRLADLLERLPGQAGGDDELLAEVIRQAISR